MASLPQQLSAGIRDKFQVVNNTFKREVKANPKDRIEVEVGDSKQPDFKPQFKVMRWSNEVNFSMRAQEHPQATVETDGEIIKYITPEYEVHQYEKPEVAEDGGFEFEWVLPSKPSNNILQATIQTKGLDFFKQLPLTQEEIDEGADRPDNVINSYAVYHKTKGGMNRADGMEYKTGKALHIYRLKATDANGNETWCDQNIDVENELFEAIVPQEFLEAAVYPVVVDPTFGYTSIGASANDSTTDRYSYNRFTAPEDGTVSMLSFYAHDGVNLTYPTRLAIYPADGSSILASPAAFTSGSEDVWRDSDATSVAVTAATDYILLQSQEDYVFKYDTVGGTYWQTVNSAYTGTCPSSFTPADGGDFKMSIYATYTASGGGAVLPKGGLSMMGVGS